MFKMSIGLQRKRRSKSELFTSQGAGGLSPEWRYRSRGPVELVHRTDYYGD